jgi:hypothetical protein
MGSIGGVTRWVRVAVPVGWLGLTCALALGMASTARAAVTHKPQAQLHVRKIPVGSLGPDRSVVPHGSRLASADPAVMTFASKSGGAAVCVGGEESLSDCSYSEVSPESGAGAGSVALSDGYVITAFGSSSGLVDCLIPASGAGRCWANSSWPVAEGSSPSVVALPNGNAVVTFSSTGTNGVSDCEIQGTQPEEHANLPAQGEPTKCAPTDWPAASNSSPSAVAESSGHVLVTFNSAAGDGAANCLLVNGLPYTCTANSGWPVAGSSSPSAVGLADGNAIVAFNSPSNGVADCELSANGEPQHCGGTNWPLVANTSPSAVALSDGNAIVTFNSSSEGASECVIEQTPVNCWGSGIALYGASSPTAVAVPSSFTGSLAFPASGPLPGEDTYDWLEQNCEGFAHNCFATDPDPAAGKFGNAMRYDIATSLPTTDTGGSEQFGAPGITCSTFSTGECSGPTVGEDALAGANDPKNNLNLKEMAQVTQQSNGLWEFNLGTKEPEDCNAQKYAGNCNVMYALFPQLDSSKSEAGPWNETFGGSPGSVMLVMSTRQHVASANGTFHGFLCVQLQNAANGLQVEDCGETWSDGWPSPRPIAPAQIGCNGETGAVVWSNLGNGDEDSTSWLSEDESGASGESYPYYEATYTYSISRAQLTELLTTLSSQCPKFKEHESTDNNDNNWRVQFFEDGYEGGSGVSGADIKFTVSDVHIYTAYQYVVAPPQIVTHAATNIGETSATLSGTVNPEGSEVTKCSFEYGATTAYGSSVPCAKLPGSGSSPVEVSAALTGLKAGTTYDFRLVATNGNGTEKGNNEEFKTSPASSSSYTQTIDSPNSLNAVSCIPASTDCVASDSKGQAFYATKVSATASATWTAWKGPAPIETASEAIDCPATSLCVLADATNGNLYYATSLGGAWAEAFGPAYGVDAISCASATFCVEGQNGGGYFRYATNPASTSWTIESQGSSSMNGVSCLSSSFCAMVSSVGDVYVADTTSQIESSAWTATDVDGSSALHGVACASTTSCLAVDGAGNVLKLAISAGKATATKKSIDGTNDLTAIACSGSSTCVAVDSKGNVFVSTNGGETWTKEYATGTDLTSVSCASTTLCATVDTTGKVTSFKP